MKRTRISEWSVLLRTCLAVVSMTIATALMAAPAQAGTTTIGSDLSNPADQNLNCIGACTAASSELNGVSTASPVSGVVVRWRIKAGAKVVPTKFRVIRPAGGGTFQGVGTSATINPTKNAVTTSLTSLPIHSGDFIGIDYQGDAEYFNIEPGATRITWIPQLVDGGPAVAPDAPDPSRELLVNADIEPDADGDGLGDETQDVCLGVAGPACAPCDQATKIGTSGDDVIIGTEGKDVIATGGGADVVFGLGGGDIICGGSGKDKLKGGAGNDKLYGNSGRDKLRGGAGKDACKGGAGDDSLRKCE